MSGIYLLFLDLPTLQSEMIWMLIGERMAEGKHMYKDILDDTGPLAAGTYWILHIVFGRSIIVYKVIAGLIVFIQIAYLNSLFMRYKSFDENTYIPAFVVLILFYCSFDLVTLSPALLGSTFIVFALGQLFAQTVLQKEGSDSVLLVGLLAGIALCFHFPLVIFLPYLILVGVVVSSFSFRQLLLSLIGYTIPIGICGLYYFWIDALPQFVVEYILTGRLGEVYVHVSYQDLLFLYVTPLFFGVIGIFLGSLFKSLTVNQQKQLQLMLIYLVFAASSIFLVNRRTPYQLLILIPPLAYFISMFFISSKRDFITKILSIVFVIGIPLMGYAWWFWKHDQKVLQEYTVSSKQEHEISRGKKILVLGNDLGYYKHAKQVTPYLNYYISRDVLADFEDFKDMADAYRNFLEEKPELVVDEDGIFQSLLQRIPLLKEKYRRSGKFYFLEE
ncbi:hypothetical protein [Mongoliibacter sp.]|uniref:hypothetical protein n=1 Tax=Mongoliibacter sp. TaxID=2022438 RepID=UPI0025FBF43B|nr:hypothetical protein [Mongoliibacter sp.]